MITIVSSGSFQNTDAFLKRATDKFIFERLAHYGEKGVAALTQATPVDSGKTAKSWTFEIKRTKDSYSIIWGNTNVVNGVPIAILIQLGHATGTGGYVSGRDYINPALRPIFDQMAADIWKEVTSK